MKQCKCVRCQKEFYTTKKISKYCSPVCRSSDYAYSNKEKVLLYKVDYYKLNKEQINSNNISNYYANKSILEKRTCDYCYIEYQPTRIDRKFCSNECGAANWRLNNKEYIKQDQQNRYDSDINRKMSTCLRSRLNKALKGNIKSQSTMKLIGCSIKQLRQHLESKFEPWMSWDNHGVYSKHRKTWHIDHIKPMSSYDLSNPQQQQDACNYKNLQPMLAKNNLIKGKKHE